MTKESSDARVGHVEAADISASQPPVPPCKCDYPEATDVTIDEQKTIVAGITICTYAREQLLAACLQSLETLQLPKQVEVVVSVIDNSPDQSASAVVDAHRHSSRFPIDYVVESRRGIPCARNRAIDYAIDRGIDHLIFIDDDEYASPQWLAELIVFSRVHNNRIVVSGKVKSVVPASVPDHIRYLFTRARGTNTGDRLDTCATDNVLIPINLIQKHGLRFDESNPLTGGTDTIFFVTAVSRGIEIYKCNEALVYETVPLSRANMRWLSRRKYRAGLTDAWRKRQKGRAAASIMLSSLESVVLHLLIVVAAALANRKALRNRAWLKICKSAGTIMGLLGHRVDSYLKIDK